MAGTKKTQKLSTYTIMLMWTCLRTLLQMFFLFFWGGEEVLGLCVPIVSESAHLGVYGYLRSGEATAGLPVPLLDGVEPFLPNNNAFS